MKLALHRIAEILGGQVVGTLPETTVEAYSVDSRTLPEGSVFFALAGPSHDGHDHVAAAASKGAAASVVSRPIENGGPQIVVDDTLNALQRLARQSRKSWGGKVIGVTGSAGKTTTKDAIAAVVASNSVVGKTMGNFNNHVGVPLSILHLPDEAAIAVLEIGMNHAGEIRDLCRIAGPDIGVVTNVGTAHIEAFESIDAIALAKRELIDALPSDGIAVLNADDDRVAAFASFHPGRTITFGLSPRAVIRAENAEFGPEGSRFTLSGAGEFSCALPGRAGVLTALAALACVRALGQPLESAKEPLLRLTPGKMRLERSSHHGITVWNDCYNSNPEAAKMMLELLVATPASRHIAVLGEMLELGRWAKDLHRAVGTYAAQCGISVLIGIRGAANDLVEAARDAGLPAGAASFFDEPEPAGRYLRDLARPNDAILFKGSRGTRVELALHEFLR